MVRFKPQHHSLFLVSGISQDSIIEIDSQGRVIQLSSYYPSVFDPLRNTPRTFLPILESISNSDILKSLQRANETTKPTLPATAIIKRAKRITEAPELGISC